jgi:DNA-directed RNA polymerase subunit M/transcription elongation factor TFIIS
VVRPDGGVNGVTSTLTCKTCGANSVIQIQLTLPDGGEVDFCSCHVCESRWYNRDGEVLDLDALVDVPKKA